VGLVTFVDQGDQQKNEEKEREGEKESLDLQRIFPFEWYKLNIIEDLLLHHNVYSGCL
jgi:hypothetical protein